MNFRHLMFLFLFSSLLWLFNSCYDETNTLGESLTDTAFRNISIDTCTVIASVDKIDSLETSGKGLALLGQYKNPTWGTMQAHAIIPYLRPGYSEEIDAVVSLDSLVLTLHYEGYSIGDTTQLQEISVYKLTEKVELNDNGYIYSHTTIPYDAIPLATHRFIPHPKRGDVLEIRLSDEMGEDLLTRFHENDDAVSDDRFEDYFKGICIVPNAHLSSVMQSFSISDSSAAITLYYQVKDELENQKTVVFKPNTAKQFSHISQTEITVTPEEAEAYQSVLFAGMGWFTVFDFPYLNNIQQQGEHITIESALLEIKPAINSSDGFNPLPDSVYLYIADENNVVTDAIMDYLGTTVQGGVLYEDETHQENTYYGFDITDFIKQELGSFGMYKHNLQFVLSEDDYAQTFRNLTFDNQEGITLKLRYKVYESF